MKSSWFSKVYTPIIVALVFIVGMSVGSHFLGSGNLRFSPKTTKLDQIIKFIENDYVDSLDVEGMENQVIKDLVEELDPHSSYITPESYHQVVDPLRGNFDGIGIQFRMIRDTLTVMLPLEGGPSIKAGIKAGDKIVIADGDTIAGKKMNTNDIIGRLKGPRGTQVDLKVYRSQVDSLLSFLVIRDKIPTFSLDASFMMDDRRGYIKISKFSATTTQEFKTAMIELIDAGMKSLILDLRGNTGGYLKSAIEMSDTFLKEGELIVYTKGNNRPEKRYYANAHGEFEEGNLLILIDENSASASEIVAGAIQDNDRGIIMGRRSFGKGLVQEQMDFSDGSALRLTVARYYTPTGRSIQRPYNKGTDAYYADHYHRKALDLKPENDSLFTDTTSYVTPKGKVVYGGGGIMPDMHIPIDTSFNYFFYNQLIRNSLISEYGIDYFNKHKRVLAKYEDMYEFSRQFQLDSETYPDLLQRAEILEIDFTPEEAEKGKGLVINMLKAELARLLFGEAAYFYVYLQEDDIYKHANEFLN